MKQGRINLTLLVVFILSTFVFYSCDDSSTDPTPQGEGSLVVKVTDSPFPISFVSEANVTINKIEVRRTDEKEVNPFVVISEETKTFNLIELRNGITADLAKLNISAGSYDLVRLYVASASIKLTDGQEFDLKVPSGYQTGIKIFIKPDLVVKGGLTTELLLDFDLSQSFVVKGNPLSLTGITGFNFKPVIRASNNSEAGRLTGTVSDTLSEPLFNALVWVKQDTIVAQTFTDSTGLYSLIGLPAGTYSAYAAYTGYDTVKINNVEITVANRTGVDFQLTPQ